MGHDALVEQMTFEFHHLRPDRRLHGTPLPEVAGQVLVENQRQAFGRPARLDELRQRGSDDPVAPRVQCLAQCNGGVARDQGVAKANRVAGEPEGILVANLDAPVCRHEGLDPLP